MRTPITVDFASLSEKNEITKFVKTKFVLSYLVDPASSHMLVSKIKPCMSKFKRK